MDDLIHAAERAVIERDERVQYRVCELRTRARSKGTALLVFSAVGLVLSLLLPARRPQFDEGLPSRSLPSGARSSSLLRGIGLLLPFMPGAVTRGSVSALLVRLLLPLVEQRLARRPNAVKALPALPPVTSADHIDLDRYLGSWYEISRLPTSHEAYEGRGRSEVVTTYTRTGGRSFSVSTQFRQADGRMGTVHGVGYVVQGSGNTRFRVSFFHRFLRWLPWAWSDYWILMADDNYRYALAGTPDRRSLWLLSRAPSLAPEDEKVLVDCAGNQHFQTAALIRTGLR